MRWNAIREFVDLGQIHLRTHREELKLDGCQVDSSLRWISAGNCTCIAEANRRNSQGIGPSSRFVMMIGKGGQMSVSSKRVLGPQTSLRSRKVGDPKTTDRHLRHT